MGTCVKLHVDYLWLSSRPHTYSAPTLYHGGPRGYLPHPFLRLGMASREEVKEKRGRRVGSELTGLVSFREVTQASPLPTVLSLVHMRRSFLRAQQEAVVGKPGKALARD